MPLVNKVHRLRKVKDIQNMVYHHEVEVGSRCDYISCSVLFSVHEYFNNVESYVRHKEILEEIESYNILVKILCEKNMAIVVSNLYNDDYPVSLICQYILKNGYKNVKEYEDD